MNNFIDKLNIIISEKKFEFFLLISFLVIFLSINTKPSHFYNVNHTIFGFINYLRFTLPFLLIFPLIYLNLKSKKINKIIYFFLFYFGFQVAGALLNIKLIGSNIENFYLIVDAVGILLILNLLENRPDLYNKLFKLIFIILFFSFLISFSKYLINYYSEPSLYLYDFKNFYSLRIMETTLGHSSGVSRVTLFLFVFSTLYLLIYKRYFTILFLLNIFLLTIVWGYQSRGTIIMFFIFCFFLILINFFNKSNFKLYLITLNIILSIILWEIIFVSKILVSFEDSLKQNKIKIPTIEIQNDNRDLSFGYLKENSVLFNLTTIKHNRFSSTIERYLKVTSINKKKREKFLIEMEKYKTNTPSDSGDSGDSGKTDFKSKNTEIIKPYYNVNDAPLTSGRTIIWKRIISTYDFKKIFGYGFQGDRFILRKLNKENTTFGSNSSNGYLYSLVSGGYFALLIFLSINILALQKVFVFIKKSKEISNIETKFYGFLTSSLIILILARSLIENSHSLFGIDFIIFVSCMMYINNINNSLNSN